MAKGVILLDEIPKRCVDCRLLDEDDFAANESICYGALERVTDEELYIGKPDWCPIVPLPDKRDVPDLVNEYDWHDTGWNNCIDAITRR